MDRLLGKLARERGTGKSEDYRKQSRRQLKKLLGEYPTG